MHGEGTYIFHNGDRYSGHFYKGKMQGYGEYRWADGDICKKNW